MPSASITLYRVPTAFITGTTPQSVLGTITATITDDDATLHGNETTDPGASQVFTSPAGTVSNYEFLFDTTLIYTPAGSSTAVEVPIKILSLTINGSLAYYAMAADGALVPGLSAGSAIRRGPARSGYTPIDYSDIACFAAGTRIATPCGTRRVEDIRPGDLVLTADHGAQPVRWAGKTALEGAALRQRPEHRPIRIAKGALGQGLPARDLFVSPQHRMLLAGWKVELFFGEPELLAPASHLLGWPGISVVADCAAVTYHHLAFDRHEVIFAEGAAAESFLFGERMRDALEVRLRESLLAALPELDARSPEPARPLARGFDAALIGTA